MHGEALAQPGGNSPCDLLDEVLGFFEPDFLICRMVTLIHTSQATWACSRTSGRMSTQEVE